MDNDEFIRKVVNALDKTLCPFKILNCMYIHITKILTFLFVCVCGWGAHYTIFAKSLKALGSHILSEGLGCKWGEIQCFASKIGLCTQRALIWDFWLKDENLGGLALAMALYLTLMNHVVLSHRFKWNWFKTIHLTYFKFHEGKS